MEHTGTRAVLDGIEVPAPGTWEIDPAHSGVSFVARYMMLTKVRGHFTRFSGKINVGPSVEESSVEVSIDPTSIDTGMEMRDNHLRSPDFFEVELFPEITFKSTRVERTDKTNLKVVGDLTIRGVTRPVVLDVEYQGLGIGLRGDTRAAFTASTEIDREEFGVSWNQNLETGSVLVGKKVRIELDVQAVGAAKAEAA
ncbi:MAG: YceI family protein [Actinomycetota bacterium]|nr:YceI family protein [Actinomycetota bacterium]